MPIFQERFLALWVLIVLRVFVKMSWRLWASAAEEYLRPNERRNWSHWSPVASPPPESRSTQTVASATHMAHSAQILRGAAAAAAAGWARRRRYKIYRFMQCAPNSTS